MKKGTTLKTEINRIHNIPIQYQKGWTEFYKLKFKLTPAVLIPRSETELLVEEIIKEVKSDQKITTILELGTGSGCISISIAKNFPEIRIIATDISKEALVIAEMNAKFHKVENKIIFLNADLLSFVNAEKPNKIPEIIVANLPYIPTARLMLIDPMVTEFEPKIALDGGVDGFEIYRRLFSEIKLKKYYPKILMIEIDDSHREIALSEAKRFFPNANAEIKKDLTKTDRFLKITF